MTKLTVEQIATVADARQAQKDDFFAAMEPSFDGLTDEEVYASIVESEELAARAVARDQAEAETIKAITGLAKGVTVRLKSDSSVWEVYTNPKSRDGDYQIGLYTQTPYVIFTEALASEVEIVA